MVKLHEWQARYERKHEEHGSRRVSKALTQTPSPIDVTNGLLNDHWFLEGKKFQKTSIKTKRILWQVTFQKYPNKLFKNLFSFPLRLILITQDDMDSCFQQPVHVHGHARIMKVAGKHHEHYLDQFIVKKVKLRIGHFLVPNVVPLFIVVKLYFRNKGVKD